MKKSRFFPAVVLFCLSVLISLYSYSQTFSLVANGTSPYKIVVSKQNKKDYDAAKQLSSYINQISGAVIPVAGDDGAPQEKEIIIGNNKHVKELNLTSEIGSNTNECLIKTHGNTLVLYGNDDDNSSASCVFYFIEKYLGCKVLSSSVSIVPRLKTIEVPSINENYSSPFSYRDVYYKDTYDSIYAAFNRIHHFDAGGKDRKWGEVWSSSFNYIIPRNKYFKAHPEYFALSKNGKRIPNQLDLTNEALFNEYVKNFRNLMKRYPNSKVWSVAANDASVPNYCRCDKCEAINKREGTPMGALLSFVNKIAAQFPDKIISTQAYMFYEEPPKALKPASNVLIVECGSYLLNHAVPYETSNDPGAVTYRRRLNEWLKLTKNVRVWDYVTDFYYLMCPFPNLEVQKKNLQYFAKLGIKDIFMQGNISKGGEFAELRGYIISKLLWNPNANFENILADFLSSYYGAAGHYIEQYVSLTTSSLLKSGIPLTVHDSVSKHLPGFLSPTLLAQYNQLFDNAENAVKDSPNQLDRVKTARLSLMYATLEASKTLNVKNANTVSARSNTGSKNVKDMLGEFVQQCKKHNIVKLSEGALTVDSYQANFSKGIK